MNKKKMFAVFLMVIMVVSSLGVSSVSAKTKVGTSIPTTMKWDASGLKKVSNLAGFDYSVAIRNSFVKKVERYAKRNKIKTITAKVIDDMRE